MQPLPSLSSERRHAVRTRIARPRDAGWRSVGRRKAPSPHGAGSPRFVGDRFNSWACQRVRAGLCPRAVAGHGPPSLKTGPQAQMPRRGMQTPPLQGGARSAGGGGASCTWRLRVIGERSGEGIELGKGRRPYRALSGIGGPAGRPLHECVQPVRCAADPQGQRRSGMAFHREGVADLGVADRGNSPDRSNAGTGIAFYWAVVRGSASNTCPKILILRVERCQTSHFFPLALALAGVSDATSEIRNTSVLRAIHWNCGLR